MTDVVVVTTRGAAAAQLVAPAGDAGPPRKDTSGVVVLQARPGWYALVANAKVADTLGRQSERLRVFSLGEDWSVSDLLLAPAWPDTFTTRSQMLERVQRDLTFVPGTTLRAYAEIYGARPEADGEVRYRASYQIYPTGNVARDAQREDLPGGVRLAFERHQRAAGVRVTEWLNIAPDQVPPGRYLLRLEVMTPDGVQVIGRAQIGFEIGGK